MSYTNLNLTPDDPLFKEKYQSVIDAVAQLEIHGEVEVSFTTEGGLNTWRKKFYEYQKIIGKAYRAERGLGHTLILRHTHRRPRGDYGLVSVKPSKRGSQTAQEPDRLPDTEGVVVTEADMELARRVLERMSETEEVDYLELLKKKGAESSKGGSHVDSGRSDPGGDADSS